MSIFLKSSKPIPAGARWITISRHKHPNSPLANRRILISEDGHIIGGRVPQKFHNRHITSFWRDNESTPQARQDPERPIATGAQVEQRETSKKQTKPTSSRHSKSKRLDYQKQLKGKSVLRLKLKREGSLMVPSTKVAGPDDVATIFEGIADMDREQAWVLNLDDNNNILNVHLASVGTLNAAMMHPREVFKTSVLSNAKKIWLLHNHPSGNSRPSQEDIGITHRLNKVAETLGIEFGGHLVIGRGEFTHVGVDKTRSDRVYIAHDRIPINSFQDRRAERVKKVGVRQSAPRSKKEILEKKTISQPHDAAAVAQEVLGNKTGQIMLLTLNTKNEVNSVRYITATEPLDIAREVARYSIEDNASATILAAGHEPPSAVANNPVLNNILQHLREPMSQAGIEITDVIGVAKDGYTSFRERGIPIMKSLFRTVLSILPFFKSKNTILKVWQSLPEISADDKPRTVKRVADTSQGLLWRINDGWGERYFLEAPGKKPRRIAEKMPDVGACWLEASLQNALGVNKENFKEVLGWSTDKWDRVLTRALDGEMNKARSKIPKDAHWVTVPSKQQNPEPVAGRRRILIDGEGRILGGNLPRQMQGKKISDPEAWKTLKKQDPSQGQGKAEGHREQEESAAVEDIRSDAQRTRQMAYDVGEKIGGAKKDIAALRMSFEESPTQQGLSEIEEQSPEVAQLVCTKKNILVPVDYQRDFDNGMEANVSVLKELIYARIAPKPLKDTPEERALYLSAIKNLQRSLEPVKTVKEMREAINGLGDRMKLETEYHLAEQHRYLDYARKEYEREPNKWDLQGTKRGPWNEEKRTFERVDYTMEEWRDEKLKRVKKIEATIKQIEKNAKNPYFVLGDKLIDFFTNYNSRQRTLDTLAKKKLTWDKLLNPEQKEKKRETSVTRIKWEREMPAVITRKGGRETPVKMPEDMVKVFNMRGVEFGNYVNDAAGTFHLIKAAEAFSDLADMLGISDKDISLNGRLAMAFGARGSGPALAHYEPTSKVINITKNGGAGSLAHEWGHALDNIMYQHSVGGAGSLHFASEGNMGDKGTTGMREAYEHLMKTIVKGNGKGLTYVENKRLTFARYNPARRKYVEEHGVAETIKKYLPELDAQYDREIERLKSLRGSSLNQKVLEKKIKSIETTRIKERNLLIQAIANDHYRVTGQHLDKIPVYTGNSEYFTEMQKMDGGKGKPYWSSRVEMFARVFESYIQDAMHAKGVNSDYLVHGTKATPGAPFPRGEERKMMHNAMQKLLDVIVSKGALKKALAAEKVKLNKSLHKSEKPNEQVIATRKEANEWIKGSAITVDLYHGTKKEASESIKREGFQLSHLGENTNLAGVYGAGIYLTSKPEYARFYGKSVLTVKVNVINPAYADDMVRVILGVKKKTGKDYAMGAVKDYSKSYGAEQLTEYLKEAGFDCIISVPKQFGIKNAPEIVIFEPKKIMIIDEEIKVQKSVNPQSELTEIAAVRLRKSATHPAPIFLGVKQLAKGGDIGEC